LRPAALPAQADPVPACTIRLSHDLRLSTYIFRWHVAQAGPGDALAGDPMLRLAADRLSGEAPGTVRRARRLRPLDALLLLSLLLPALLFAVVAVHDRRETLEAARRDLLTTLDALHGQAEKVFQFQALVLGVVDERLHGLTDEAILADAGAHHAFLAALRGHAGAEIAIAVFGADGRLIVEAESLAPRRAIDASDRAYFIRHVADPSTEPRIGLPVLSRISGEPILFVTRRRSGPDGRFAGIVAAGLRLRSFLDDWAQASPDPASAVSLLRDDGWVLARRPAVEPEALPRLQPASPMMRAIAEGQERQVLAGTSPLDGMMRLAAFRRIDRFPDAVLVHGLSLDAALAAWRGRLLVYGAFTLAAATALFGLALLARRRDQALHRLNDALEERVEARTAEIRASEARVRVLAREVDHRAKNVLAVVQATLRLTPKADPAAYARAVEGRVAALARAQTLLSEDRWRGADLRALLKTELAPFLPEGPAGREPRVTLDGPAVVLPAVAVQPLAMAVHELTTNAVKHGALSVPGGRVAVSWRLGPGARSLSLSWQEAGGPPVEGPPAHRGFGSRVLEGVVRAQLGGQVTMRWAPPGFACELKVPLVRAAEAA
jgi:two-component sensor histidine kinase